MEHQSAHAGGNVKAPSGSKGIRVLEWSRGEARWRDALGDAVWAASDLAFCYHVVVAYTFTHAPAK